MTIHPHVLPREQTDRHAGRVRLFGQTHQHRVFAMGQDCDPVVVHSGIMTRLDQENNYARARCECLLPGGRRCKKLGMRGKQLRRYLCSWHWKSYIVHGKTPTMVPRSEK